MPLYILGAKGGGAVRLIESLVCLILVGEWRVAEEGKNG